MGYASERRQRRRERRGERIGLIASLLGNIAKGFLEQKRYNEQQAFQQAQLDAMTRYREDTLKEHQLDRESREAIEQSREEAAAKREQERTKGMRAGRNLKWQEMKQRSVMDQIRLGIAKRKLDIQEEKGPRTAAPSFGMEKIRGLAMEYGMDPDKIGEAIAKHRSELDRLNAPSEGGIEGVIQKMFGSDPERMKYLERQIELLGGARSWAERERGKGGGSPQGGGLPTPAPSRPLGAPPQGPPEEQAPVQGPEMPPATGSPDWQQQQGQGAIDSYRTAMTSPPGTPGEMDAWLRLQSMFPALGGPPQHIQNQFAGTLAGQMGGIVSGMGSSIFPRQLQPLGALGQLAGPRAMAPGMLRVLQLLGQR